MVEIRRQAAKDLAALNLAMDAAGLTEHPLEDSLWTVIQILARAMPHDSADL